MGQITFTITLALAVLLGGCGTPRSGQPDAASNAAASEPAPRIASPVSVPAAAARNVVLTMTGPKVVVEAKDWAEFKREWRETFSDHAKDAGIAFSFAESAPQPGGQDGTLLLVNVADYRNVGIGSRLMFGIMTGNAFIDARIRFVNLRDGTTLGEQQYNTTSRAMSGVFANVTPQQVNIIATEIFTDLKAAR